MIFQIIASEGGAQEASMVTEDCLKICCNTLADSVTCQRLFFDMQSGWHLILCDFFDPSVLESLLVPIPLDESTDDEQKSSSSTQCWFQMPHRVECAALAVQALVNSLGDRAHAKHQVEVAIKSTSIVPALGFWLTRRGPSQLVRPALALLAKLTQENAQVSAHLFESIVKYTPPLKGKTVPLHASSAGFVFSWKPLPNDERRLINLPALLLERYINSSQSWNIEETEDLQQVPRAEVSDLLVLDAMLAADPSASRLIIQFILAPPPPSMEDMDGSPSGSSMESGTPLGCLVLNTMLENMGKMLGLTTGSVNKTVGVEVAERCSNVLALVYLHGDEVARELGTALSTGHTILAKGVLASSLPLLSYLLTLAGKSARVGETGYSLAIALLKMLSTSTFKCERAARQLLDDPANLFVLDMATTASEVAGMPQAMQSAACLFLGTCYDALQESEGQSNGEDEGLLSQASLLRMIDGRIGLTRFTELLKAPLLAANKASNSFFFTPSFQAFYDRVLESILHSLFQQYSSKSGDADSSERQIIAIQLLRIAELEAALKAKHPNLLDPAENAKKEASYVNEIAQLKAEVRSIQEEKDRLQSTLHALSTAPSGTSNAEEEVLKLKRSILDLSEERQSLMASLAQSSRKVQMLEEDLQSPVAFEKEREKKIADLEARNTQLKQEIWALESKQDALETQNQSDLSQRLLASERTVLRLQGLQEASEAEVLSLKGTLLEKDSKLEKLEAMIVLTKENLNTELVSSQSLLEEKAAAIVRLEAAVKEKELQIENQMSISLEKDDHLRLLKEEMLRTAAALADEEMRLRQANQQVVDLQKVILEVKTAGAKSTMEIRANESRVQDLEEEVVSLKGILSEKDIQLEVLKTLEVELQSLQSLLEEKAAAIVRLEAVVKEKELQIENQMSISLEKDDLIKELREMTSLAEKSLAEKELELGQLHQQIRNLQVEIEETKNAKVVLPPGLDSMNELTELREKLAIAQVASEEFSQSLAKSEEMILHLQSVSRKMEVEIISLEATLSDKDMRLEALEAANVLAEEKVEAEMRSFRGLLEQRETLIESLEDSLKEKQSQIEHQIMMIQETDDRMSLIESLEASLNEKQSQLEHQIMMIQEKDDRIEQLEFLLEGEVETRTEALRQESMSKEECGRLVLQLKEVSDRVVRLTEESARAEMRHAERISESNGLRAELEAADIEFQRYKHQMEESLSQEKMKNGVSVNNQMESLLQRVESLQSQLSLKEEEEKELRFQVANLGNAVEAELRASDVLKMDHEERMLGAITARDYALESQAAIQNQLDVLQNKALSLQQILRSILAERFYNIRSTVKYSLILKMKCYVASLSSTRLGRRCPLQLLLRWRLCMIL